MTVAGSGGSGAGGGAGDGAGAAGAVPSPVVRGRGATRGVRWRVIGTGLPVALDVVVATILSTFDRISLGSVAIDISRHLLEKGGTDVIFDIFFDI